MVAARTQGVSYGTRLFATVLVGANSWKIWYLALTNANFSWHVHSSGLYVRLLALLLCCGTAVLCVLAFCRLA